jgi:hypothetical protein
MKSTRLLGIFLASLVLLSCATFRTGPARDSGPGIAIVYTGNFDWKRLPELATLIRKEAPALTIITGQVLDGGPVTYLFKGQAEIAVLARSGVTALCLTPDFLELGTACARKLIDSVAPSLFFLSANILDSARHDPLGQAFVKLDRTRTPVPIALLGFTRDSTSDFLHQLGITRLSGDAVARRYLPQMRMSSDVVGAVASSGDGPKVAEADFTIGSRDYGTDLQGDSRPDAVYRFSLVLGPDGRISRHRTVKLSLDRVDPDPVLQELVRAWRTRAESSLAATIADVPTALKPAQLVRMAAQAAPVAGLADAGIFPADLPVSGLPAGSVTLAQLFEAGPADRLVRVLIKGEGLRSVLASAHIESALRQGLNPQQLNPTLLYTLVTTAGFARSNPLLRECPREYLPVSLAQVLRARLSGH